MKTLHLNSSKKTVVNDDLLLTLCIVSRRSNMDWHKIDSPEIRKIQNPNLTDGKY
jgi:hypothetical protein